MQQWGLQAPKILQVPLFSDPKGRALESPIFHPSKPGSLGAKISGDPIQNVKTVSDKVVRHSLA